MSRRTIALAGALAGCAALLAWRAPDVATLLPRPAPPPPLAIESLVDDRDGALLVGRARIEDELRRFHRELGIAVHVVMGAGGDDPDARAAARLAETTSVADTGRALVLVDHGSRRVGFAATDAIRRAAPPAIVRDLLCDRAAPFVGEPLVGVAIASGLERLRDFLLEQAARGALALGERARSAVRDTVAGAARASAACAGAPSAAADDVESSVRAFACLLADGAATPDSDLFTDASRVHLARRPLLRFESRVRAAALEAARPWQVSVAGDRAAVGATRSVRELVPVLLVREHGAWRIDLVEMGKAFQRRGRFWKPIGAGGPYWLALGEEASRGTGAIDVTPVELWGEPLASAIERLERTETPAARARLAEILLRNAWLPGEALVRWEEALAMAPGDLGWAEAFADRAEIAGHPLLGAIALAPHGAPAMSRIASLFLAAGQIEPGIDFLRRANAWKKERSAERTALPSRPSI
ncbi:MAG: hypothetical protein DCC71_08055 [Proteobacteria bacterium]|nr:MAG: hypothetical protein DCC71_08055 [Pseudomonadota bacterium]